MLHNENKMTEESGQAGEKFEGVEVTPEMIKAGVILLWEFRGSGVRGSGRADLSGNGKAIASLSGPGSNSDW